MSPIAIVDDRCALFPWLERSDERSRSSPIVTVLPELQIPVFVVVVVVVVLRGAPRYPMAVPAAIPTMRSMIAIASESVLAVWFGCILWTVFSRDISYICGQDTCRSEFCRYG